MAAEISLIIAPLFIRTMGAEIKHAIEIGERDFEKEVTVAGWVHEIRDLGGVLFLLLRDGTGILQVTALRKKNRELCDRLRNIPRESVIKVRGIVRGNTKVRNGYELLPEEVVVLSEAEKPLPLDVTGKVGADIDTRFRSRWIDLRKPEVQAIFRIRSQVLSAIRHWYDSEGFIEVQTPKIVQAGAEGGASLFPVDYFGRKAYLSQSPQLYKQMLMASGLERVYEIGPAFRAEESRTLRHLSEFSSVDVEMAFIDIEDLLRSIEELMAAVLIDVRKECTGDLETLGAEAVEPTLPLPRIPYSDAISILRGKTLDPKGERIVGDWVRDRYGAELYFIVDFPSTEKPFYIKEGESFDLEYKGMEITSGGMREHRLEQLMVNLGERGLDPEDFDFYLNTFRYGMPPHGGYAIGLDRLIKQLLGLGNVREAVLFPRDKWRLVP